jgi:hypothetical protein
MAACRGIRCWLLPMVLSVIGGIGWAARISLAQSPDISANRQPEQPPAGRHVSLQPWQQGTPRLWISYPWKLHTHASLELYLATSADTKPAELRPMFFRTKCLPGKMDSLMHDCQDHAEDAETRRSCKVKDINFQIIGRRNSLERLSVLAVHRIEGHSSTPDVAAALPLLPCWALNERLLCIDLPVDAFAEAGAMHIWLLRGEQVLWSEMVDWPGRKP